MPKTEQKYLIGNGDAGYNFAVKSSCTNNSNNYALLLTKSEAKKLQKELNTPIDLGLKLYTIVEVVDEVNDIDRCPKCGSYDYVTKPAGDETYHECNDCKYYSGD